MLSIAGTTFGAAHPRKRITQGLVAIRAGTDPEDAGPAHRLVREVWFRAAQLFEKPRLSGAPARETGNKRGLTG
jgi:hypothetical protein